MNLHLLLLFALTSLIHLAHTHCIHVSGNAHNLNDGGDMQTFSVLYFDGTLVCTINRAVPYGPSVPVKYDCHDGHYATLTEYLEFVLYSHDKNNYKIPTNEVATKFLNSVAYAWEWDARQGC